ncbi:helix-turn-helix domain-containing protein [Fusobacterium sp.]|uniref:helix-turn-helix domain-containing protein n=1 Tax=Fusobacterium sp. TaxID=68766 RepID=UPI00262F851E|nr:helix-turn-helix domain-containing protein [Fusobacterium sp.]
MSLNRKEFNILDELLNRELPLSYFSEKYKVSERNIRYSIDNLNFYLNRFSLNRIILKKGVLSWQGSQITLNSFIEKITIDEYIFSKEERENYILINYLFSENTKITDIEKYLKVSRPTIKKDILALNLELKNFELEFVRENNSITIKGKEKKLRHLKLLKLLEYIEIKNNRLLFIQKLYITEKIESSIIKNYLTNFNISTLYDIILKIEKKLNVSFDNNFKDLMCIYLIPTLERIRKNKIILKKNNSKFLRNLSDYNLIKNSLSEIIPENLEFEFLHLTEYFISGYYSHNFSENLLLVQNFIEEFSKNISVSLNFDFYNSNNFREEILKYLLPAVYRIKNNFFLLKKEKTSNFNKIIYERVKTAVLSCNSLLEEPFREDEIIYLTEVCENYIESDSNNGISLTKLLNLIRENCNELKEEKLILELLTIYKNKIYDDRK